MGSCAGVALMSQGACMGVAPREGGVLPPGRVETAGAVAGGEAWSLFEGALPLATRNRYVSGAITWMGGRVVEGTGLENRQAGNRLVGSNPTPSANSTP